MTCYRYVTPALHGRWRSTLQAALVDAMRAGQARADPDQPGGFAMLESARIEERSCETDEDCQP